MDFQFYPTPKSLAKRAWAMFKNTDFVRVLDPSAGNGDLLDMAPWKDDENWSRYRYSSVQVDCCEIDFSHHANLREKRYNIVGFDFLQFGSGSFYTHAIANPPFKDGAKHALKLWDVLWEAEMVVILNAETIRNPYTAERRLLVNLIEQNDGHVEYMEGEFATDEAERKTNVEVALVYLRKRANVQNDIIGTVLQDMREDLETGKGLSSTYKEDQQLAHANTGIDNMVVAFNAAVKTMKESVISTARANYYERLLGETMATRNGDSPSSKAENSAEFVQSEMAKRYEELKDRAWAQVLRSTEVESKISRGAQKRIEAEFEFIKKLEFTQSNIYSFLLGLVQSQGQIRMDMACDVFDIITRYHSDNVVYVMGWKSNDKHRTCGMKIKASRFVLPGHATESYNRDLPWDSYRLLDDIDKVFAMLDGKTEADAHEIVSLRKMFDQNFNNLRHGARISGTYFDVRYYPGIGTIHFFPTNKKLVDRLNRLVGHHRQWLPAEGTPGAECYWTQYDQAEKFDKEVRAEVRKQNPRVRSWDFDPMDDMNRTDQERRNKANAVIGKAIETVLERHGISTDYQVTDESADTPKLESKPPVPAQLQLIAA